MRFDLSLEKTMKINGLRETIQNTKQRLLSARNAEGFWEGELSTSALSTATAMCALAMIHRHDSKRVHPESTHQTILTRIQGGGEWLCRHQNPDGGWGDTVKSHSNISTTVLAWAALGLISDKPIRPAVWDAANQQAERWITGEAGGVTPAHFTRSILKKYGKDKTFSVPILTHCALSGKMGAVDEAWENVLQLPFELAACPHSWFAALRLPVVSYALPALIAIGIVRHHHRPSGNRLLRWIRNRVQAKTLRKLESIQPSSGGFLEAVPLTSFVTMSLAASVGVDHPVAENGLRFLLDSVREDGSWAIDTNLATWVTTLSVNALGQADSFEQDLSEGDRNTLLQYLLEYQYQTVHPYTHAAPGGWAWTHLPGGVPDADDTSGALWALHHLRIPDERLIPSAAMGSEWLLSLQNSDGGVPTFCRGWANLPFDRSCADITAHAVKAISHWKPDLQRTLQRKVERFERRAYRYLAKQQSDDGSWVPLWFGNQDEPHLHNKVYGTAQVVAALAPLMNTLSASQHTMIRRGARYLVSVQKEDGSWGGGESSPASLEESALALTALGVYSKQKHEPDVLSAIEKAAVWFIESTCHGTAFTPAPIGFYFAELWYYELLYPMIYTLHSLHTIQGLLPSDGV